MYIPKGTILYCPCCKAKLYKFDDVVYEGIGGLEHMIPMGSQNQITRGSSYVQKCYKCKEQFNSKALVDSELI